MDITDVELRVNGAQAEKEISKVRKEVDDLKAAWIKASAEGNKALADKLNKELKKSQRDLRQMESGVKAVEKTLKQLNKATPADLNRSLKFLQNELKHIDRGSDAWKQHTAKIRLLKGELEKVNAELRASKSIFERMKDSINNWGASIMAGVGALSGIVMAGKKAVSMYAEMQQEEANVRKYTGMTAEEVEHLNEEFKKMDTRTSREGLNQLAQEAGRLGKQSEEDVLGFVRAADKINVALDELGEGATLTLSKLTTIFGDEERLGTERSLLAVGSVINELSQNSTAAAPYLAEFGQRLAGVGAQAHMTIPEIMGFGAVLDSQGQKLEMSATALSKVIMNLFKNPEKIANATGLAVEEFSETCKRSTNEGLMMLLDRLHELGGIDALAPVFADMGENGARASAVLAALAGNVDMVRQQQETANIAFQEAVSIDKEYEVQNTTVQAGLEKARKGFQEMAITLGKELMPIVENLISGTSATMRVMLKTIQFIKENRIALIALTAALSAYYALAKGQEAWNTFVGGVKKAISAIKAFNAALLSNPYAAIGAALVGIGTALALVIKRRNEMSLLEKTEAAAQKEINEQYAEQRAKIDMLNDAVHDETLSMQARQKALEQLKALVPDYHASLTDEGKLINDNADAIDNYTKKLEKQIQMQVYQEKLTDLYRQKMQAEENITNRQADLDEANRKAAENGNKVQMRTSMGAAGPTGGYENSYSVNVRVKTENLEGAKRQLGEVEEAIEKIKGKIKDGDLLTAETGGGFKSSVIASVVPDPDSLESDVKSDLDIIDEWRKREQALNDVAYAFGQKSFSDYNARKLEIESEYHDKRLGLFTEGSTEYLQEEAAFALAEKNIYDNSAASSLQAMKSYYADEKRILDDRYMKGEINYEQYNLLLEEAELEHLSKVVTLYKEGSEEYLKAQDDLQKREHEIQKKRFDEHKKIEENIKKTFFTDGYKRTEDKEEYDKQSAALDVVKSQLEAQAKTNEERLKIDKAYHEAKYLLAKEYNQKEVMESMNAARAVGDQFMEFLESDLGQSMVKGFGGLVNQMSGLFSGLTTLIDRDTEQQTKKIEAKYDAEIKAAGNNEALVASLEEKKQAEIAKVNTDAANKKFNMQVIEAVATGIQSAVSAFAAGWQAGIAGVFFAPMFMAMSLATTGIQIAALKKQRDLAASTGYAEGGYTRPGKKYQPAGIVHAGEWVASQELLANPTAAATIAQLDQAQRTNTIGQLSKPAPGVLTKTQGASLEGREARSYNDAGNDTVGASIDRLNKTLDNGIYAATLMTGDKGIVRQQKRYNQLMKNKSK